jgi:hypothetical protein
VERNSWGRSLVGVSPGEVTSEACRKHLDFHFKIFKSKIDWQTVQPEGVKKGDMERRTQQTKALLGE